jgi:hypothetical protein
MKCSITSPAKPNATEEHPDQGETVIRPPGPRQRPLRVPGPAAFAEDCLIFVWQALPHEDQPLGFTWERFPHEDAPLIFAGERFPREDRTANVVWERFPHKEEGSGFAWQRLPQSRDSPPPARRCTRMRPA